MPRFAAKLAPTSMADTFTRTARRQRGTAMNFSGDSDRFLALEVEKSTGRSEFLAREKQLQNLRDALTSLDTIGYDWDTYGADAPSTGAINSAWRVLTSLREEGLYPDRVLPSAEGGVAFTFFSVNENRAVIETLNDGENFVLLYDRQGNSKTLEWNWLDIPKALLGALKEHLKGSRLAAS